MGGKLNSLQVGRGFAALAVVLFHTNESLKLPKYTGRDVFPIFDAGNAGVEYFFVLSGFVMLLTHQRDIGSPERALPFIWKRFTRIYPPLWYVILLMSSIAILFHSVKMVPENFALIFVSDLFVLPSPRDYIVPVEWTLRHEVIFYILCVVLIVSKRAGCFLLGVFFVLPVIFFFTGANYPVSFVFSEYNILFGLGGVAAYIFLFRFQRWALQVLLAGALLFGATWASVCSGLIDREATLAVWAYGLGAALLVLGAASLEQMYEVPFPRVALFLGEASYSIYLVHIPAMIAASDFFVPFAHRAGLPDSAAFIATASCALGAGMVFHLVVERPSIALARIARVPAFRSNPSRETQV